MLQSGKNAMGKVTISLSEVHYVLLLFSGDEGGTKQEPASHLVFKANEQRELQDAITFYEELHGWKTRAFTLLEELPESRLAGLGKIIQGDGNKRGDGDGRRRK